MEGSIVENGPNFNFPTRPTSHHTTPDQDHIVTTIKNIVKTIINPQVAATSTHPPTTLITTPEMPEINTEQMAFSNETMVGLEETTNSTISLMETFQNNSTIQNTTIFTEMPQDTNVIVTATDIIENATSFVTESVTTTVDAVTTTTRSIINTVSESVTKAVTPLTTEEIYEDSEHHGDGIEQQTLCIVLGVILGCLIVIMIILLIIYKRYKARNCGRSGAYCISKVHESDFQKQNV